MVLRHRIIYLICAISGCDNATKNTRDILSQDYALKYMSDYMVYIGYDYGEIKNETFKIYTQPEYNQQEYEFLIDDCIDSERCKRPR